MSVWGHSAGSGTKLANGGSAPGAQFRAGIDVLRPAVPGGENLTENSDENGEKLRH